MKFKCGWKVITLALPACFVLAGCGGGGNGSIAAGPGGSQGSVVTVGKIDAFGSVFVNGVEYATDGASYLVNGSSASDDGALSVGMVVRVKGSRDNQGKGTATEVRYDEEINGPAAAVAVDPADGTIKHFMIFGQPVVANATTVFKGDNGASYGFADLADGDHVEVSGDYDGDALIATFIELKGAGADSFEAKGTVSDLNGSAFVLTLRSGSTLNVMLASSANLPAGLQDGALVEVKGTVPDTSLPQDFVADRVRLQDNDDFDGSGHGENESDAEISGVLAFDGAVWSIRGTTLEFSSATSYRPDSLSAAISDGSASGLRVEVEGPVVDGVLQVTHIRADGKADGTDELSVQGYVAGTTTDTSAGTTTVTVSFAPVAGTVDVIVDSQTLLMNDNRTPGADLSSLVPDVSFVRVRGHLDATGAFVASALKIEDKPDEYAVRGPLDTDGLVPDVSISVLGVTFNVDAGTVFKGGTPVNGDHVEVHDRDRNGFAEVVEVENATNGDAYARPDRSKD